MKKGLITMSEDKEKKTMMTPKTRLTIQIVGAGIFGALSTIAFPILKPLIDATRVPQGLALFDPISIIWMCCFLIFGPLAGILCCFTGFLQDTITSGHNRFCKTEHLHKTRKGGQLHSYRDGQGTSGYDLQSGELH